MSGHEPATIPELLWSRAADSPFDRRWFRRIAPGNWVGTAWGDLAAEIRRAAAGLVRAGLKPGERLAIYARTCPEWAEAELATLAAGGVVVGIDPHASAEQASYVLEHSRAAYLLVDDAQKLARLPEAARTRLKWIAVFDDQAAPPEGCVSWQNLVRGAAGTNDAGGASRTGPVVIRSDAPATVIYTSGTTGQPKGISYTHRQLLVACQAIGRTFPEIGPGDSVLSWLPMAHLLQRMMNLVAISRGAGVYFVEDPREVVACLREVEPSVFVAVPRFYERLYEGIDERLRHAPRWLRGIVQSAIRRGGAYAAASRAGRRLPLVARLAHQAADRLVLRRIRRVVGRNMKFMVTGSAPTPAWLLEYFHGLGLLILEAYGISENTIPMAANRRDAYRFGSVGRPLEENEIRLADDGELLVRGPGVFAGYDRDDGAAGRFTADGFYRTGDIGRFDDDGFLYLVGRKSELIKTSTGRRLSPVSIEAAYARSPYLDQVVVMGNGRKHLVGLVVLRREAVERECPEGWKEQERAGCRVVASPAIDQLVRHELETLGETLAPYERIARFAVLAEPLSVARGELTPTLKIRRDRISERYAGLIEALYREPANSLEPTGAVGGTGVPASSAGKAGACCR